VRSAGSHTPHTRPVTDLPAKGQPEAVAPCAQSKWSRAGHRAPEIINSGAGRRGGNLSLRFQEKPFRQGLLCSQRQEVATGLPRECGREEHSEGGLLDGPALISRPPGPQKKGGLVPSMDFSWNTIPNTTDKKGYPVHCTMKHWLAAMLMLKCALRGATHHGRVSTFLTLSRIYTPPDSARGAGHLIVPVCPPTDSFPLPCKRPNGFLTAFYLIIASCLRHEPRHGRFTEKGPRAWIVQRA
jgi:hypothetical protein